MDDRFTKPDGKPTPLSKKEKAIFKQLGFRSRHLPLLSGLLDDPKRLEIARRAIAGDKISEQEIEIFAHGASTKHFMSGETYFTIRGNEQIGPDFDAENLARKCLKALKGIGAAYKEGDRGPVGRALHWWLEGMALSSGGVPVQLGVAEAQQAVPDKGKGQGQP